MGTIAAMGTLLDSLDYYSNFFFTCDTLGNQLTPLWHFNVHYNGSGADWAADLENDQTPPCQGYTDYVGERMTPGRVTVNGQQYTADQGTRQGLDAYFSRKTDRLKPHLTSKQFNRFVQGRIAEGRMQPVAPAATA